jgi:predicted alpha/beta hydrolase family esterase
MVAVPDPSGRDFPPEATGFKPLPLTWKGTRPMIVSSNDPYASEAYTLEQVRAWRAVHVRLGAKGHINGASGLGDWDEGWQLVDRLRLPGPAP